MTREAAFGDAYVDADHAAGRWVIGNDTIGLTIRSRGGQLCFEGLTTGASSDSVTIGDDPDGLIAVDGVHRGRRRQAGRGDRGRDAVRLCGARGFGTVRTLTRMSFAATSMSPRPMRKPKTYGEYEPGVPNEEARQAQICLADPAAQAEVLAQLTRLIEEVGPDNLERDLNWSIVCTREGHGHPVNGGIHGAGARPRPRFSVGSRRITGRCCPFPPGSFSPPSCSAC